MNNRNWLAVFLGLACLVLFVSVMGASGNWLNNNNSRNNNGATPQQINQTVKDMNKAPQDNTMPTEIDADKMTDTITGNNTDNSNNNTSDNNTGNGSDNTGMNMPSISIPKITQ